ncbi:MAG: hypothetical protein K2K90_05895 [Lachnospiraceae bacterium]|nr:hypothetical protein [Lachnospiraceae bacterium]
MKNMKKLLQKAMVFTLAAAMLVGTPLSASAAGLVDLYKVEDGWGNVIEQNGPDDTRTGTVSATESNSGVLKAKGVLQGIGLSEKDIKINTDEEDEHELTAYLEWDGEPIADLNETLPKSLRWSSSNNSIVAVKVPGENGSYEGAGRETIKLIPKAAGTVTVTVSLESSKYPEISKDFRASTTVTVVQYADGLKFEIPAEDAFSGNALVLDDYVKTLVGGKEVETPDVISYAVIKDGNKAATLKNGVLTLKKATAENEPVIVRAMGKKDAAVADAKIDISAGVNATKITFSGTGVKGSALTQLANDGLTAEVTAKVTGKKFESKDDKEKNAPCTDKITWSSVKPEIVEVSSATALANDECKVNLTFKSAGKTQVIGKTSAGKSFKLNVTVNAELTGVELSGDEQLYTGQIIDLNDRIKMQLFANAAVKGEFKAEGLVKWEFTDKKTMAKVAKLNAKTGVLEILPDLDKKGGPSDKKISIKAVNAKKNKTHDFVDGENVITFTLVPVNVTSISIMRGENNEDPFVSIASGGKQDPKSANDSISVGKTKTYKLVAKGTIGDSDTEVDVTDALAWTASGNGKTVKAVKTGNIGSITAVKKGSATVTVSGTTVNSKNGKRVAIKATFKEKVNAPTETIALSVKNLGVAATGKNQTISITPVIAKGSTTNKTKDIVWTATKDGKEISITNGKIKANLGTDDLGAKIRVTARVKNGPSASITLTVVKPSKSVVFEGEAVTKKGIEFASADAAAQTATAKVVLTDKSEGTPGQGGIANVTYTMNKAGIARIVENKSEGTITIYPLAKGKVTITAKTSDGKSGKLNVTVK